jgi:hypothetical protein
MTSPSNFEKEIDSFLDQLSDDDLVKLSAIIENYTESFEKQAADLGVSPMDLKAAQMIEGFALSGFYDEMEKISAESGKTVMDILGGK